jgi:DNA repair protein RadA/Sms
MAKAKTAYVCNDCGAEYSKWQGQCGECNAWNTLSEFRLAAGKASKQEARGGYAGAGSALVTALAKVSESEEQRTLIGTRPRARRRFRARLGHAARRRSRHRQIDAADRGGRRARAQRQARRLCLRRRSGRSGRMRAQRLGLTEAPVELRGRNQRRRHCRDTLRRRSTPRSRSSTRSRPCGPRPVESAPGTVSQVRGSAAAVASLREGIRHRHRAGRSRDQRRPDRGPAWSNTWSMPCFRSRATARISSEFCAP